MDDTESIQMSRHTNKEIWEVLSELICSHDERDNSQEYRDDEFCQYLINLPKNVPTTDTGETGGSSSLHYGHVEKLESHARMVRFD